MSLLRCVWHYKSIFLSWNNLLHWFPWHHTLIFLFFLSILLSLTSFLLWAHSSLSSQEIRAPEDISPFTVAPRIRQSHSHPWIQFLCAIKIPKFKFSVKACFLIYLDLFNKHLKYNTCKTTHFTFVIHYILKSSCPHYFFCRKATNTYFILSAEESWKMFLIFKTLWSRVSQPLHYWHVGPDNSLLWGGGSLLCNVGCSPASLTYTHWMPLASLPSCDNQTVSRHCQMPPREAKPALTEDHCFPGKKREEAAFIIEITLKFSWCH